MPNTRERTQFLTPRSLDFLLILLLSGIFDPTELISGIRQLYKTREGWLSPFPWCEEFQLFLGNIFTRLKVVRRKKTRGEVTDVFVDMSSILDRHEECSAPRTVLIEGEPGIGKTTYCKKYAYDWATKKQEPQGCSSKALKAVLLLKCRDIDSDVWEAIDDQLLPREIDEEVKQKFSQFIATSIAEAIKVNQTLTNLGLSRNAISFAGATSIAEAIKVNKTLTHLNLWSNGISNAGSLSILFLYLDLSDSDNSDTGSLSLAEAIKVNKTLTVLSMSRNSISEASATSIAEAIKGNKNLTVLNLSDNRGVDAGATKSVRR